MTPTPRERLVRCCASPRFRRAVLGVLVVLLLVQGYVAVVHRRSDLDWHLKLGGSFLAGDPYRSGGQWYPLGRAMFNAVFAAVPCTVAKTAIYLLAIAATFACFVLWRRMADSGMAKDRAVMLAAAMLTLVMLSPYVLRDLDECGLQLLLLFFLTCGAYALHRRRPRAAGAWFAVAATYKVLPVLFFPYLLWKRQWQAAAWMIAGVIGLSLLPAIYLGWETTVAAHQQWLDQARASASVGDPLLNAVEPPNPRNLGLQVALARYLQHARYPQEHLAIHDHPLYLHFGSLSPTASGTVVKLLLLGLAAVLAWRSWRSWQHPRAHGLVAEWAVLTLLCALLSPLCWKHHLVLVLPCVFFVMWRHLSGPRPPRWRTVTLIAIAALVMMTKRFLTGRELSLVLISYKFDTLGMLLAMLLVMTLPCRAEAAAVAAPVDDDEPWHRPKVAA